MSKRFFLPSIFAAILTITGVLAWQSPVEAADGVGKNLKVLKGMNKAELKKYMKGVASSLGVQCDHCHDTDNMAKDTPKKEIARGMMVMVNDVNTKYFKGDKRVGCVTCHNGKPEPAKLK
jgi:hypothetical protein